ncbi:unnamed protein product [Blumeria hordei]|uniref:BHLH domain-containing protein n=2 Tax=Blumeria hordei TaxID=2867405 RepID=A0A383UII2_BLUHO|nr:hypothetical protein BGHDH14_bgh03873 [Blumeria hordei DH14]SZE99370.1 unnamed protein product [Blumeria hordei]
MAGTGLSSPFVKNEPDDFYTANSNQRTLGVFPQHGFGQFSSSNGVDIDPNSLAAGPMANSYGASFQNNYGQSSNRNGGFDDDELLDSLGPSDINSNQTGMNTSGDFGSINHFEYSGNMYGNSTAPLSTNHNNAFSNTSEVEPLISPYVHNFNHAQFRLPSQNYGNSANSMQSPNSFTGSPMVGSDILGGSGGDPSSYARQRSKIGLANRKCPSTRSPLTPKTPAISSLHIDVVENGSGFPTQPIQTATSHRHQKTLSGQWDRTSSSLNSFGGDFSPIQGVHLNAQISDILKGTSMPAKLNNSLQSAPSGLQSQEMKRRRRRESHNLVERRRRDNINERIQELSHLVPMHRLEDEKVRKALQNNSPLSPTIAGTTAPALSMSPPQATSGLAGPGARRATAGNITTGIPIDEKDKGPNKGDILNGAVSWTRDLMWMLHLKLQQQEELANYILELGGSFPFQPSEDERRMQTELMDAMLKNDGGKFQYSRAAGSGLRVPKHTDIKGDAVDGTALADQMDSSQSPESHRMISDGGHVMIGNGGQYWNGHNSVGSGAGSISFKEEDEYGMDLTQ